MTLTELRYIVALAEERHFGRAAARLHMTQPPLSRAIKQLETDVGALLMHRSAAGVTLTPAGTTLYDEARALLEHAEHARARVAATAGTAAKRTPQAGTGTAGGSSSGAETRRAPQAGTGTAGGVPAGTGRKLAPQSGPGPVGAGPSAVAPGQRITAAGAGTVGAATVGAAAKHTAGSGTGSGGAASSATLSSTGAKAETGTAATGPVSSAAVVKVARPAGAGAAGVGSAGIGVRVAAVAGRCTAGPVTAGSVVKTARPAGAGTVGGAGRAAAGRRASTSGTAAATATAGGAAARAVGQSGTAVCTVTAGGVAARRATAGGACEVAAVSAGKVGAAPVAVPALDQVVAVVLDCVGSALAGTAAGRPGRVCTVPGLLAWDGGDCGLLAVTVDRVYPSSTFPVEAQAVELAGPCPPQYEVAELTVTVLRCAPTIDSAGRSPSCTALDRSANTWFRDMDATRAALGCCLAGLRDVDTVAEFVVRDTTPAGPEGGCVGSDTHLTVGFVACLCPTG